MGIAEYVRERRREAPVLLMTHIVVGYPSYEESFELALAMVDAGVDLMELQIPFSEPMADGPVILRANQEALRRGVTVDESFRFAADLSQRVDVPLLFMSYYNVVFRRGVEAFARDARAAGVRGAIVPDLPFEEGSEYERAMKGEGLDPIGLVAPNTPDARMRQIAERSGGMVYCVARKGVTGAHTDFSGELESYLDRVKRNVALPLAVGFGLKDRADVDFVRGKADIAVVGSASLRVLERSGVKGTADFVRGLRG